MLGMTYAYAGAPNEGLQHGTLALRLSPRDPQQAPHLSVLGLCHLLGARLADAAHLQRRAVEMRPHFVSAWRTLASAGGLMGHDGSARSALVEAVRLQPGLSLAWVERYHPIVRESDRPVYAEGLRKAGLA